MQVELNHRKHRERLKNVQPLVDTCLPVFHKAHPTKRVQESYGTWNNNEIVYCMQIVKNYQMILRLNLMITPHLILDNRYRISRDNKTLAQKLFGIMDRPSSMKASQNRHQTVDVHPGLVQLFYCSSTYLIHLSTIILFVNWSHPSLSYSYRDETTAMLRLIIRS